MSHVDIHLLCMAWQEDKFSPIFRVRQTTPASSVPPAQYLHCVPSILPRSGLYASFPPPPRSTW